MTFFLNILIAILTRKWNFVHKQTVKIHFFERQTSIMFSAKRKEKYTDANG